MFARIKKWLKSLFGKAEPFDTYTPTERLIFHYYDGKETVHADPYVLFKRMMKYAPELDVAMRVSVNPLVNKDQARDAHDEMIEKIRDIFSVKPFEQSGLTELETVELLNRFLAFCGSVKKNSKVMPTNSTPSEPPLAQPSSPPTPLGSVSGSTENASSTDVLGL